MFEKAKLEPDLDQLLDELWKIEPKVTYRYLDLRAKLLLIQTLRNLKISWR